MKKAEVAERLKDTLWETLSCCGCGCCCHGSHQEGAKEIIHLADDEKVFNLTPGERDELDELLKVHEPLPPLDPDSSAGKMMRAQYDRLMEELKQPPLYERLKVDTKLTPAGKGTFFKEKK